MFISPIRNILPFPKRSMAKTYSDKWHITLSVPWPRAWGKCELLRRRQLGPLTFQLCFSWSAFLLSLAQRFVPHPTSSLCTEELLLRPKLKWLMKLCDTFPLHWVIGCHEEWSANMGPGMLLMLAVLWCQLWAERRVTARWQQESPQKQWPAVFLVERWGRGAEPVAHYCNSAQEVPWGPMWCHGHHSLKWSCDYLWSIHVWLFSYYQIVKPMTKYWLTRTPKSAQ